MLKRTEIISELCKRYHINAAESSETLSIVLDNKNYRSITQLHRELNMLEFLGEPNIKLNQELHPNDLLDESI